MARTTLLLCGILSSVLFITVDLIAANQWAEYRFTGQAFSELTAVEAPTRPLMMFALSIPYNLLSIAFAAGIWATAAKSRALRVASIAVFVHAIAGFVGSFLFPMHSRGQGGLGSFTDRMHIASTAVEVLGMMVAIGFAAIASCGWFRAYSIATIVLLLAGGALAGIRADEVAQGLPTPWMGITERINIYGFMAWVVVFAVVLLRSQPVRSERPSGGGEGR